MCENCVCGCLRRRSDQLRLRGVEKNERICQSGLYVKTSRMASKKCAPNYITKKQNGPSHYREWEIPIPLVNMKQLHTQTGKTWVIEIDLWSAMTRIDNVKNQSTREILQSFFFFNEPHVQTAEVVLEILHVFWSGSSEDAATQRHRFSEKAVRLLQSLMSGLTRFILSFL